MKKLLPLLLGLLLALTCAGFAEGEATKPENYDGVLFSKVDKRLICYPEGLSSDTYTVPQGIRIIGGTAFSGCSGLTSVSLPDSLTSIGYDAFKDCDSLTLTVPRDSYAKQYCDENGLRYIYPDSNDWLND